MFSFFRSKKMRTVAMELEMNYFKELNYREFMHLEVFELFQRKSRKKIRNVLSARDEYLDITIDIFDFGHRKDDETKWQSVILIQGKKLVLPQFVMRPSNIGDKLLELFSNTDIDFELYPRFSRNYIVKGQNEVAIRYLMHDDFLEYFNGRPGWYLEGIRDMFILYKRRKRMGTSDIPFFHDTALEVYELLLKGGKAGGFI
jgi:hypothetical protein